MRRGVVTTIEVCLLVAVPLVLGICAFHHVERAALFTALVAFVAIIPFFLNFERSRPRPRDFMPIAVLSAFAAAGRIIFAPLPNVKPVTAIVIVSGISFGREAGFLVGALAALLSNIFFGQGPWTPWQMYAWGLVGYIAGIFGQQGIMRHPTLVYVFGFLAALFYGFILDSWYLVGYTSTVNLASALVAYGAGFPLSIVHAVATVLFLLPILQPWSRKFERIKRKFGLITAQSRGGKPDVARSREPDVAKSCEPDVVDSHGPDVTESR